VADGNVKEAIMLNSIKRLTIAQHERGLRWKNGSFVGVLGPGVYCHNDFPDRRFQP
jgi:hypothetical protein